MHGVTQRRGERDFAGATSVLDDIVLPGAARR
jgi:hypothetical protein